MTQTDFLEFLKKFNEENLTEDDLLDRKSVV